MLNKFCPYCMSPVEEGKTCSVCGLTAGTYTPSPHHLPPGTVLLDRYLVGRVLGEGGFGITYIGCDLRLELKVAIKEYFPSDRVTRHASTSLAVEHFTGAMSQAYLSGKTKFLREARTMARMDKQHQIVGVRDFFEANNTAYIVMEYVEGTTFKELVRQKGGRIPAGELLHIIEPLFPALSAMHEQGLIHRDISPDNLMLENGQVRLLDFGCARESSQGSETLTIALKHGYAPIEQYQNRGQGPWTDVYALCATIYYCLTGKAPAQALDRMCGDELTRPRKLGVELTENQENALIYGLGILPSHRFQSVRELYASLYEGVPAPPTRPVRIPFPPPPADDSGETPPQEVVEKTTFVGGKEPATDGGKEPTTDGGKEPSNNGGEKPPEEKHPRRWPIAVAAGAAAVCLVSVLALLNRPETGEPEPSAAPTETVAAMAQTEPLSTEPDKSAVFAGALVLDGQGEWIPEERFREALADDSVPAVVISGGSQLHVESMDFLKITKPVLLETGCYLDVRGETAVSGPEGMLYLEGDFSPSGLTRTEFGGKIYLADDAAADISSRSLLLLERPEDLVRLGDGQGGLDVFDSHLLSFCEDEVFANAVRLDSGNTQELLNALDRESVSAISIAGDYSLDLKALGITNDDGHFLLYCSKPLRLEDGASLTVTGGEIYLDSWGEEADALLVNRGVLNASLNTSGDPLVLNFGRWEGGVFGAWETVFVNFGDGEILFDSGFRPDMDGYNTIGDNCQFYNLGQFTIDGAITLDVNGESFNYGVFRASNGATVNIGGTNPKGSNGCQLWNYGRLESADSANLGLCAYLMNRGGVILADNCQVENRGLIHNLGALETANGGEMYNVDSGVVLSDNPVSIQELTVYPLSWEPTPVSTPEELLAAVKDPNVSCISITDAAIEVSGDLWLTKPLYLCRSGSLTVNGDLYVNRTFLLRDANDGQLCARTLHLTNRAALLQTPLLACQQPAGRLTKALSVAVENESVYLHGASGEMAIDALNIFGGCFASLASLSFSDSGILVSNGGIMNTYAPLTMFTGDISIAKGGSMDINAYGDLRQGVTITNEGLLQLSGMANREDPEDGFAEYLPASIHNTGRILHGGNILFLTGKVVNQGKFFADCDPNNGGEMSVQIGPGGSLSGNPILQWSEDFDWRTG